MLASPDSLNRLPLSCAIAKPRRKASSARTGLVSRWAKPYANNAYERTKGLPVASAASTRPFADAAASPGTGDGQCEDHGALVVYGCRDPVRVRRDTIRPRGRAGP